MFAYDTCPRAARLGILLVLLAACATPKPTIRTDADRHTDFTQYHTFNFAPKLGTDRGGYSTLITGYFKQSVLKEMEARGYRLAQEQPQLLLNFNTNVREVADVYSYGTTDYYGYRTYGGFHGNAWYGDTQTMRYKVGTVNVDLIDAGKNKLVWEAVAEGELSQKAMDNPEAAIDKVVAALFERFPVESAKTAAQAAS